MTLKLKLKLIETGESSKTEDLVRNGSSLRVLKFGDNSYPEQDKVVKPYGISDDEIKIGDKYWDSLVSHWAGVGVLTMCGYADTEHKIIQSTVGTTSPVKSSHKVNILPEQFNYQEIVDLGLKDGDVLNGYFHMPFDGKVPYEISLDGKQNTLFHITKPTPVTYTEKNLDMLLNEFGNELMNKIAWGQVQNTSNGVAQFVMDFMKNKKK
jgi:hypothetical protein